MNKKIIEKIRKFVEDECRKPIIKYGFEPYEKHFFPVRDYIISLSKKKGADLEIVEIASLSYNIGYIIYRRDKHHLNGVKIVGKKLFEFSSFIQGIKKVLHYILTYRGSNHLKPKTLEAEILIEADAMNSFDRIGGLFKVALVYEKLPQLEIEKSIMQKLENKYNQLSPEGKDFIK